MRATLRRLGIGKDEKEVDEECCVAWRLIVFCNRIGPELLARSAAPEDCCYFIVAGPVRIYTGEPSLVPDGIGTLGTEHTARAVASLADHRFQQYARGSEFQHPTGFFADDAVHPIQHAEGSVRVRHHLRSKYKPRFFPAVSRVCSISARERTRTSSPRCSWSVDTGVRWPLGIVPVLYGKGFPFQREWK